MIFDLFVKNNTEKDAQKHIDLYMACCFSLAVKTDMEEVAFQIRENFYKRILGNRYSLQ